MKKLLCFAMTAVLLLSLFGCNVSKTDISVDQIIDAYDSAGYQVSFRCYEEITEWGIVAEIQAEHPNGESIYFYIFDNEENARQYKEELYHPGAAGFFSILFGDPFWMRWEVYGEILVQYTNAETYKPFEILLKSN